MSTSPINTASPAQMSPSVGTMSTFKVNVAKPKNQSSQGIVFETEESRLRQKCKDLKQKIIDVEGQNELTAISVSRAKQSIKRLRFEYLLLLEALERKAADLSIPTIEKLTADDIDTADIESIQLSDITHLLSKTPLAAAKDGLPTTSQSQTNAKRKRGNGANSLKKQRLKDPNIPKRPTNAYLIFCEHEKDKVRKLIENKDPSVPTDLSKAMTEQWKKLDDVARKPYYELYEQDRLRYQREIKAYNMKMGKWPVGKRPGSATDADISMKDGDIVNDDLELDVDADSSEIPLKKQRLDDVDADVDTSEIAVEGIEADTEIEDSVISEKEDTVDPEADDDSTTHTADNGDILEDSISVATEEPQEAVKQEEVKEEIKGGI